ncbi:MarR family winged helix-turn-helix transcriptional regulator [Sneathiella glossodoripedis]|uniref:MarR family winged helix-turn-helix transcriptional regulator n=1 Tax=Sneathiella glossodoripedis TaxID=418853 RepID=UPI0004722CE2|nr:MarR family transcriptional regulator [Sneathiella glossodoripedis]
MIDELSNRLFFRLYQTANTLQKVGAQALESEQITTQQWSILGALSRTSVQKGMTVSELCEYLRLSRQNLTGVLKRLEERGLISRTVDDQDQRKRYICLSEKGHELWGNITPLINKFYDEALRNFSPDDRISFAHYLNKLGESMHMMDKNKQ